ncbi:YqeB family protein [Phycicoccus avicenniae]|uniref:YqeB family protein n=1 Tax=Phycicoccus avicenniae TaxID=2828860 RepID=UPI003D28D104
MGNDDADPTRRIGGFDTAGRTFVVTLFGGVGLALGLLLPWLAGFAADNGWVPFGGPVRWLASFDGSWLVWGRPLIGLVLGLAFAAWVLTNTAVLHVGPQEVRVERRGSVERVIPREAVDGVHRRGSKVVIESAGGRVLFRDDVEGDQAAVREAFVGAGYPWEGPPA